MRIIEMVPRPPSSILLLGRSGTGKTTVLVFRLFSAWLASYQHSHQHLQAVFVTASATLKEQVSAWGRARGLRCAANLLLPLHGASTAVVKVLLLLSYEISLIVPSGFPYIPQASGCCHH